MNSVCMTVFLRELAAPYPNHCLLGVYAVEWATLVWADWFNHRRLLEPIGYLPPAEVEADYYRQITESTMAV